MPNFKGELDKGRHDEALARVTSLRGLTGAGDAIRRPAEEARPAVSRTNIVKKNS